MMSNRPVVAVALGVFAGSVWCYLKWFRKFSRSISETKEVKDVKEVKLFPCIKARRSVFPRDYIDVKIDKEVVACLLEAAIWAPFHGPRAPWRFVVLGVDAMREMQRLTLCFYDENWQTTGWAGGKHGSENEYREWRAKTEEEIYGRWGPVSYMIAIIMRRQAHPEKRMPEWEEAAAVACAVQNMHIQATAFPGLACYWSSWHVAARDSSEMKTYLGMEHEDKCLGFFMVAACRADLPDRRIRHLEDEAAEWRT
mgnify:FL=1